METAAALTTACALATTRSAQLACSAVLLLCASALAEWAVPSLRGSAFYYIHLA